MKRGLEIEVTAVWPGKGWAELEEKEAGFLGKRVGPAERGAELSEKGAAPEASSESSGNIEGELEEREAEPREEGVEPEES